LQEQPQKCLVDCDNHNHAKQNSTAQLGPTLIESKVNKQPGLAVNAKRLGYRV